MDRYCELTDQFGPTITTHPGGIRAARTSYTSSIIRGLYSKSAFRARNIGYTLRAYWSPHMNHLGLYTGLNDYLEIRSDNYVFANYLKG